MARYYGGVHGARGPATRLGHGRSGLKTFANGWRIGAQVTLQPVHDAETYERTDEDFIFVTLTSGSDSRGEVYDLGRWNREQMDEVRRLEELVWSLGGVPDHGYALVKKALLRQVRSLRQKNRMR